jgi:hypothetical protein
MVYDSARHQAHSLNLAAALIWQRCDGKTSVPELARLLHTELSLPVDEELVWLALSRLERAQLLEGRLARPPEAAVTSRRTVLRKLGLSGGLALLLPVVTSLAAPKPVLAQSITTATTTTGTTTTGTTTTGTTTTGTTTPSCIPNGQGPCQHTSQCCAPFQCKLKNGMMICC